MASEKKNLTAPQEDQLYGGNEPIYVCDKWTQCQNKPTKLYQLDFYNGRDEIESPKSHYFIDENTYNNYLSDDGVFDVQRYCNDAQIAPYVTRKCDEEGNPISEPVLDVEGNPVLDEEGNPRTQPVYEASYKNHISCYEVPSDVSMWEGEARANYQYGEGGAHQYFVPEEDISKLKKDENFVSPTIPEEDRRVDPYEAQDAVNEGKEKNQAYRDDLQQTPMQKEARNADEIVENETPIGSKEHEKAPTLSEVAPKIEGNTDQEDNRDTLKNVADENKLEKTSNTQDNGIKNDQNLGQ